MNHHRTLWEIFISEAERNAVFRDAHGRFTSNQARHPILEPVVSKALNEMGFRPRYPNGAPYALVVSHDMDVLRSTALPSKVLLRQLAGNAVRLNPQGVLETLGRRRSVPVRQWSIEAIAEKLDKHSLKSSFFFLSLQPGEQDFNYLVDEIAGEMRQLLRSGHEIGLHGGHEAYRDAQKIASEQQALAKAIGAPVTSYRNHYLKFDTDLWGKLQGQGFAYDTTFGFAESPGFRNGMTHPFHPYDPDSGAFLELAELPLMVMDQNFYKYLRIGTKEILQLMRHIATQVRQTHGVLTLLWHNNALQGQRGRDFDAILDMILADQPWVCTGKDLIAWYTEQGLFDQQKQLLLQCRDSGLHKQ